MSDSVSIKPVTTAGSMVGNHTTKLCQASVLMTDILFGGLVEA